MARIIVTLLLLSGAALATPQQPSERYPQDNNQPLPQKVITNPAEYNAYINALNIWEPAARKEAFERFIQQFPNSAMRDEIIATEKVITDSVEKSAYAAAVKISDPAARQAALESFLERFPSSVMRDQIEDLSLQLLVERDNLRTAPLRQRLRSSRARGEAFARALAWSPDNLNQYTRCGLGEFSVEESSERDRPFMRTVPTAKGEQEFEVLHSLTLHVTFEGTPFVNFKAEKLGNEYATKKQVLLDSMQYLSEEPDTKAAKPWPATMNGFEVYGINRKQLTSDVLSLYLLFHDSDMTVVTLYLLNTPPETPKFRTLKQYYALRDQFLRTYTTCTGELLPH